MSGLADRHGPTAPRFVAIYGNGELIGDALYKIPFARAARNAFPDARIVWLTNGASALDTHLRPLLDGVVDDFGCNSGIGASPWQLLRPARIGTGIEEPFSVILDTQSVIWRTLAVRRISHDLFISPAADFRLSDRRPPRPYHRPPHIVDRLIDLLELATGHRPPSTARAPLAIPADLAAKAAAQLPHGPTYVGLAPGAGQRRKCWPLERYIDLARAQAGRGRVPVFIIGPAEQEWLPAIQGAVPEARFPEQDTAVWGSAFSPLRTIALARRLQAAVANDSGISHMFGIAEIPLLVLYGPTSADKFRPMFPGVRTLKAQDFGGDLMTDIPVAPVAEALDALIAQTLIAQTLITKTLA